MQREELQETCGKQKLAVDLERVRKLWKNKTNSYHILAFTDIAAMIFL